MNTSLKHFGIPGMKWGIRRRQPSSDSSNASSLRKKHVDEMTNDELKTVITRMQLERQYKDLSKNSMIRYRSKATEFISRLIGYQVNSYIRSKAEQSNRVRDAYNSSRD